MMIVLFIFNIVFLVASFIFVTVLKVKKVSLSFQTLLALVLGTLIGIFIYYTQFNLITKGTLVHYSLEIYRVISEVYVNLLKAMIYPLIIVAILTSLTKINSINELSSYGVFILLFLLLGVIIASSISIIVMYFFGTNSIVLPMNTLNSLNIYTDKIPTSLFDMIINFFPSNPFLDFTGSRSSSTVATVTFLLLIGISYLLTKSTNPEETNFFKKFVESLYVIIMKTLSIVIHTSPYGIMPLIATLVVTTNVSGMLTLAYFLVVIIVAIVIMFLTQTIIITLFGFNPVTYYKKVLPLLTFAFFSRSSAASIPFGIDTQVNKLGIHHSVANLSTTLGAIIGQAGCIGIYVTVVIFMTSSAIGHNPWSLSFIIFTIFIVTVTSFGIGGIGGGAIYGALIALAAYNYPVAILSLLIPIEVVIDMFRTIINVNGLTISGLLTSKVTSTIHKETYCK